MIFISWGGISKGGGGKENSPNIAPLPGKKILNTPNLNSEYAIGVFLDFNDFTLLKEYYWHSLELILTIVKIYLYSRNLKIKINFLQWR